MLNDCLLYIFLQATEFPWLPKILRDSGEGVKIATRLTDLLIRITPGITIIFTYSSVFGLIKLMILHVRRNEKQYTLSGDRGLHIKIKNILPEFTTELTSVLLVSCNEYLPLKRTREFAELLIIDSYTETALILNLTLTLHNLHDCANDNRVSFIPHSDQYKNLSRIEE